ncbi:hypothetical protein BDR05DRAFT_950430 [Suillus weaverae]|nr:hypothetical protein BDR05DRAFT_950430 [Suillus weaverae]
MVTIRSISFPLSRGISLSLTPRPTPVHTRGNDTAALFDVELKLQSITDYKIARDTDAGPQVGSGPVSGVVFAEVFKTLTAQLFISRHYSTAPAGPPRQMPLELVDLCDSLPLVPKLTSNLWGNGVEPIIRPSCSLPFASCLSGKNVEALLNVDLNETSLWKSAIRAMEAPSESLNHCRMNYKPLTNISFPPVCGVQPFLALMAAAVHAYQNQQGALFDSVIEYSIAASVGAQIQARRVLLNMHHHGSNPFFKLIYDPLMPMYNFWTAKDPRDM